MRKDICAIWILDESANQENEIVIDSIDDISIIMERINGVLSSNII